MRTVSILPLLRCNNGYRKRALRYSYGGSNKQQMWRKMYASLWHGLRRSASTHHLPTQRMPWVKGNQAEDCIGPNKPSMQWLGTLLMLPWTRRVKCTGSGAQSNRLGSAERKSWSATGIRAEMDYVRIVVRPRQPVILISTPIQTEHASSTTW